MNDFFNALQHSLGTQSIVAGVIGVLILIWLRKDMRKQREWRERKEQKIAKAQAKIARRKAQNADVDKASDDS